MPDYLNAYVERGKVVLGEPRPTKAEADAGLIPETRGLARYQLVRTCRAFPEQWEVFRPDGAIVGYLRLRGGRFTVEVPDVGGKLVLDARPEGYGDFEDRERADWLRQALWAIHREAADG